MDVGHRKVEKRNRPPVSCEPCRTRKLKCNRAQPCDSCIKRDKASACHYAANATRNKSTSAKPRDLKDRLNSLENLVSSLLSGDAVLQAGFPTPSQSLTENSTILTDHLGEQTREDQDSGLGSTIGKEDTLTPETLHLQESGDGHRSYIDPSHWLSILDDIKEIREHVSVSTHRGPQYERSHDGETLVTDPGFLFAAAHRLSSDEIIAALPPRSTCDMLLSWYFNSRFMILGIVHPQKFQDEYTVFWDSPDTTSLVWVALLFAILSNAVSLRRFSGAIDPDGSIPPIRTLQQKTVQCLVLGRYTIANFHALEAIILYVQSCHFTNSLISADPWLISGTIIRLAFRMGYHRDPKHLAGISAFDGEMRRRVWLNIVQLDALMSFQLGFPSMIPTDFCDSEVPRNLEHSDLYVSMVELPPSRPLTENTPVLYIKVKASIMAVFKKIVAHTQSLSSPTYEAALALENDITEAYRGVPDLFKRRDVNQSFIDHAVVIWQRCTIEVLYLKGLIVLHRRYISHEARGSKFEHSRQVCVDAALDIIARQTDLHTASQPGGRLYEDRWMILALPAHDFLMAAMVICLDLSVRMRTSKGSLSGNQDLQDLVGREYRALQTSQRIWAGNSGTSPDAQIAASALDLMIRKVAENDPGFYFLQEVSSADMSSFLDMELPYADSMSHMIEGSEMIDWSLLDQYLQNMNTTTTDSAK
ncbi:Fusarisetin A cluster transcription factor fsa6 [Paramyrothecium foliicola]|nr:Fusarisetin A cluster transcription factor fsa6 [Paramyrothecium foliicola]